MCGRFSQTTPADILQLSLRFDDIEPEAAALLAEGGRYNICPTQDIVVVAESEGRRKAGRCRWGLVPSWAKDPAIGARMINARGETLADKPSFRRALVKRRCVVPADGFFEWRAEAVKREPWHGQANSWAPSSKHTVQPLWVHTHVTAATSPDCRRASRIL